mgnify:CR=1 FL=1
MKRRAGIAQAIPNKPYTPFVIVRFIWSTATNSPNSFVKLSNTNFIWCYLPIIVATVQCSKQRILGVVASLFIILIIPELWKNQTYQSMEIEATSYYSLRQIYAARMSLFLNSQNHSSRNSFSNRIFACLIRYFTKGKPICNTSAISASFNPIGSRGHS